MSDRLPIAALVRAMATAHWTPVANLPAGYLDEHSEALKDILSTYLRAPDLGRLTTVCRALRSWSDARRPKLAFVAPWRPHGAVVGADATMALERTIKVDLRMQTVYANEDGNVLTMDVPPGNAVDPDLTTLCVTLMCYHTRKPRKHLYLSTYWKKGHACGPDPATWGDPQSVKFQIPRHHACVSNNHSPPAYYFIRFTLEVGTHNKKFGVYVCDSPPFYTADMRTMLKRRGEAQKPPKRRRRTYSGAARLA